MKALTKQEALIVQDLYYQVVLAEGNLKGLYGKRSDALTGLAKKYKIKLDNYDLDIGKGQFVKKEENGKPS